MYWKDHLNEQGTHPGPGRLGVEMIGATGQEFMQKGRVARAVSDLHEGLISEKLQQSISHTLFDLASTFVEVVGKCVTEPVLGLLTRAQ